LLLPFIFLGAANFLLITQGLVLTLISVMVFKEVMRSLANSGKTIFYSSHIMVVVEKVSDRILLINDGQVVADGSFEELNNNQKKGSLEEIFNQLTGFNEHAKIAKEFVSLVYEV